MKSVILYSKIDCPICEEAKQLILTLKDAYSFTLDEVDIYKDDLLLEKYQLMIPVVEIDCNEVDFGQIELGKIINALSS
ncbi:glutaredoxin family protein [Aquibacillus salsiterrae]|uniref:Glutaredoxin family protein n=1 Tax=Aquibacillus salsiterrae TaxID=2950439 RepID=A0A9X3WDM7_9BACI|nr:glutaredoxin family protein [Aquibacillus salsiterrae]MDC3416175.1 glutaredoxin family protein [Aquibacillus salsiterrae]